MTLLARTSAVMTRRQVLWTLVVRDLKVRYAGSVLGYVWTVLDPLAMACIYWFVFTVIFKARRIGEQPYVLFLVVGLLAWQWFSASMTDTSRAIISEARLVRSTNLPRERWVLRVVIAKGLEFVFSLPVLVFFVLVYHSQVHVNWRLVLFPVGMVMQMLLLTGIGLLLAPVSALVTDTQRVVRIFLRAFFYLTPVIYGTHAAPQSVRPWLALNPMTGVLEIYRSGLFAREMQVNAVMISGLVTLMVFVLGAWVFSRLESSVLKEI